MLARLHSSHWLADAACPASGRQVLHAVRHTCSQCELQVKDTDQACPQTEWSTPVLDRGRVRTPRRGPHGENRSVRSRQERRSRKRLGSSDPLKLCLGGVFTQPTSKPQVWAVGKRSVVRRPDSMAKALRPQYLVQPPFEPPPGAGPNDCLLPRSARRTFDRQRPQPLRMCRTQLCEGLAGLNAATVAHCGDQPEGSASNRT